MQIYMAAFPDVCLSKTNLECESANITNLCVFVLFFFIFLAAACLVCLLLILPHHGLQMLSVRPTWPTKPVQCSAETCSTWLLRVSNPVCSTQRFRVIHFLMTHMYSSFAVPFWFQVAGRHIRVEFVSRLRAYILFICPSPTQVLRASQNRHSHKTCHLTHFKSPLQVCFFC